MTALLILLAIALVALAAAVWRIHKLGQRIEELEGLIAVFDHDGDGRPGG